MLRPSKPVVMIVKYHKEQKNEWKSTKSKRIAQVSFQVRIDASYGSTRADSETGEIEKHNNWCQFESVGDDRS